MSLLGRLFGSGKPKRAPDKFGADKDGGAARTKSAKAAKPKAKAAKANTPAKKSKPGKAAAKKKPPANRRPPEPGQE